MKKPSSWSSVSLDAECGLKDLRALHEHLQARILEMIESLDELRARCCFENGGGASLQAAGEWAGNPLPVDLTPRIQW